jgi:hypothetical protein
MSKTPEMEEALDHVSKKVFGRSRKDPACVVCGSDKIKPTDFKDDLSRKEFTISRMCQKCQDSVFGSGGI